jgi:hypothetical protein
VIQIEDKKIANRKFSIGCIIVNMEFTNNVSWLGDPLGSIDNKHKPCQLNCGSNGKMRPYFKGFKKLPLQIATLDANITQNAKMTTICK